MAEVAGKDQQAFYQRQRQDRHHHNRHIGKNFANCAANRKQGRESSKGGKHREDYGHCYSPSAADSCAQSGAAALAPCINAFTNDDRIVHDQAQSQNKAKEREHIDARSDEVENGYRANKGDPDPQSRPASQANVEEQSQRQQYEEQADCSVFEQQTKAVIEKLALIVPDGIRDAFRKRLSKTALQIVFGCRGDIQHALVAGAKDFNKG